MADVLGHEPWHPPPAATRAAGAILLVVALVVGTVVLVNNKRAADRLALAAATVSVPDPHDGDHGHRGPDYTLTNASHRRLHLVTAQLDDGTPVPLDRDLRPGGRTTLQFPLPTACPDPELGQRPTTMRVRFKVAGRERLASLDVQGTGASYVYRSAVLARCAGVIVDGSVTGAVTAVRPGLVLDIELTNVSRRVATVRNVRLADGLEITGGPVVLPAAGGIAAPTVVRTSMVVHVTDCRAGRVFVSSYADRAFAPRLTMLLGQDVEVDIDPGGIPLVEAIDELLTSTCT